MLLGEPKIGLCIASVGLGWLLLFAKPYSFLKDTKGGAGCF